MTAEPDALRLVPVEPTKAMLAAGQAAGDYGDALRRAWSAMLSAAPTVPLSTQPVEAGGAGREEIAKHVYEAMRWAARFAEKRPAPEWVEGGNSDAQYEARKQAAAILAALSPASPTRTPMGGEVEALRETLERIRDLPDLFGAFPPDDQMREIARQALAASSPSPAQGGMAAPPSVQPVEGK